MKQKINKIQIFRHIVQIITLFLLPSLFMLAFGELKGLYNSVINGSFAFPDTLYSVAELIIVILLAVLFGRFFCGWACAFGTYGDFLHELSSRVFHIKFRMSPRADRILKYLKYAVLVFLIIFVWTIGSELFMNASPWDAFASITALPEAFGIMAAGFALLFPHNYRLAFRGKVFLPLSLPARRGFRHSVQGQFYQAEYAQGRLPLLHRLHQGLLDGP